MALNLTIKPWSPGLEAALLAAGYAVVCEAGVFRTRDDVAAQAIVDAYDPLPYAKAAKIAQIKSDGVARAKLLFPAITDFDTLDLVSQIMQSVAVASRTLTARITTLSQIWTAGANAATSVNAATTVAQVDAVTVTWPA